MAPPRQARTVRLAAALAAVAAGALAVGWAAVPARTERVPRVEARGTLERLAQPTRGTAEVVDTGRGARRLVLRGFETKAAPELFLIMVPRSARDGEIAGGVEVGRLRRPSGSQSYDLPPGAPAGGVVVWCKLCSSAFGAATLRPA